MNCSDTLFMSQLEPKGIFLGLVLLALAVGSIVLVFKLRPTSEPTPQNTAEAP